MSPKLPYYKKMSAHLKSHAVKKLHSYECPCIVALPIENGYQPYLDWIRTETPPKYARYYNTKNYYIVFKAFLFDA